MVSGEKRNCETESVSEKTAAILLDVEGTTTSINFVKDTLFTYVHENLKAYVDSHWNDEEFKEDLKALKQQVKKDQEDKVENLCLIEEGDKEKESVVQNVLWQMDLDRKTTALKQLQGHIWREGYEKEKLKGHVYNDVPPMLKKWCENDKKLYIYSSGSVEAQKLLFKNSEAGDLETYLTGHFDTETGPKTEASSYANIAKAIGLDCNQILFLTDSVKEAVAADKAGLQVNLVVRDGNAPLTDEEKKAFTVVTSFKDLVFESSNKKKKLCEGGQEGEKVENVEHVEETDIKSDEKTEVKSNDVEKMDVDEEPERVANGENEDKLEKNEENRVEIEDVSESVENKSAKKAEEKVNNTVNEVVEGERGVEAEPEPEVDVEAEAEADVEASTANGGAVIEEVTEKKESEENVVSTSEISPVVSESISDSTKEEILKEEKIKETSTENEADESKSVNGVEKSENHENHSSSEASVPEANGSEGNGTSVEGEISESVPIKKVTPEKQADSTVEVTA